LANPDGYLCRTAAGHPDCTIVERYGRVGHAEEAAMTARDLMTTNPVTASPLASLAEVWDLMRDLEIRHVPVVEDGALVGMLSDRDLSRLDMSRMFEGADALRQELSTPIVKVMNADVIAIEPETDLDEIIDLLLEHKVGALPVVRLGSREVVGIVSYIDVLRAIRDELDEAGEA
jgi:CBS domain-containing protein